MVWVALDDAAVPVGFVWLDTELEGGAIGIAEIDVLPAHGRQGIGAALLEHACEWAQAAGYRQVDLGTLPDVPWNAPFYARHGFVAVDARDPAFAFARQRDLENGFPADLRVFMSRPLAAPAADVWTAWPAPAKLNLFLRITGRRPDGYHELQTVFRLLDWGDEIRLRVRADGEIHRLHDVPGVPESTDLAVRAARLLQQHAGVSLGADIAVEKRVPMGGGLGGGSSDAATVLVALNWLWRLDLDEGTLAELGRRLGADVPVFVRGRSAWAEGIGEQLTPLPLPRRKRPGSAKVPRISLAGSTVSGGGGLTARPSTARPRPQSAMPVHRRHVPGHLGVGDYGDEEGVSHVADEALEALREVVDEDVDADDADVVAATLRAGTQGHAGIGFEDDALHHETSDGLDPSGGKHPGHYLDRIFGSAYTDGALLAVDDLVGAAVLLHPFSRIRLRWDVLLILVSLYLAFSVPLRIAFDADSDSTTMLGLQLACNGLCLLDMLVNFNTGFDDEGLVQMSSAIVRSRYLSKSAFLDGLAATPWGMIPFLAALYGLDVDTFYLLRLTELLNMLPLRQTFAYTEKWQDVVGLSPHFMALAKLLCATMLYCHFYACLSFFAQASLGCRGSGLLSPFPQIALGLPADGWLAVSGLDGANSFQQYCFAMLRALKMVMAADPGVVSTQSVEMVFTFGSVMVGVLFYTIIIGLVASIILSLDKPGSLFVEKMQAWKDYCYYKRLPRELRMRVLAYVNHTHSNKKVMDEAALLQELPPAVRVDVYLHLCAELVTTVPIFLECSPIVVRAMVAKLQRETLIPGDYVFRIGDIADAVYFILKGTVSITASSGTLLTVLSMGSHFGEFGLLAYLDGEVGVRTADARSEGIVELYKLTCPDFEQLSQYYPEIVDFFRTVATVRTAYNAMRHQSVSSAALAYQSHKSMTSKLVRDRSSPSSRKWSSSQATSAAASRATSNNSIARHSLRLGSNSNGTGRNADADSTHLFRDRSTAELMNSSFLSDIDNTREHRGGGAPTSSTPSLEAVQRQQGVPAAIKTGGGLFGSLMALRNRIAGGGGAPPPRRAPPPAAARHRLRNRSRPARPWTVLWREPPAARRLQQQQRSTSLSTPGAA
ncbi:MAG: hypothetical protein WDW38_007350 [Sanguina aurantia]